MRVKHWQGYGSVECLKHSLHTDEDGITTLTVELYGNHEYGLVRDDEYDLINWLVKRFDKKFNGRHVDYSYRDYYVKSPATRCDVEHCVYTFRYRRDAV